VAADATPVAKASANVATLPWLAALRRDERARVATRFRYHDLAPGVRLLASPTPTLGIVLGGSVAVTRPLPDAATIRLTPGDRWGEVAVFADLSDPIEVTATTPAVVATLDRPAFLALAAEHPILWLAVAERLSRELKTTSDLLREIREVESTDFGRTSFARFLATKRRQVHRRAGIARDATSALFRRLVGAHVREPAFWMLAGFVGAIAASRLVVAFILGFGLQEQLFNLQDSGGANPVHVHHFNYGFAVLVLAGLLAFFPRARRGLRTLAALFGIGLGLVFDEFALIWNLDPNYYQPLSYHAQGMLAALLAQLVYFRRVYADFTNRVMMRLGRRT
jgi:CRP-like cAMP-binding protein